MNKEHKIKLFLVDDDAFYLKSLEIDFMDNADFDIETFSTGELCLENLSKPPRNLVSSRIKFMIKDLFDCRENNWVKRTIKVKSSTLKEVRESV